MTALESRLGRARANALGWTEEPKSGRRRRPGRIVAGVVLLVVAGWVSAAVYLSVGSREEVVAVAGSVEQYNELTASDLTVVRVASDPGVSLVPASDLEDLVGRVTSVPLVEGALLHEDQLLGVDDPVIEEGDGVVGTVLEPADAPANLVSGASVQVILRPAGDTTEGSVTTLDGWVLAVSEADSPGVQGQRVSLVVPDEEVASVSAAAAEGRVSVAVLGEA